MSRDLAAILLDWNNRGEIRHSIKNGYSSVEENNILLLAPSLPMLISHQFGSMRPSYGLILCSQIIDYLKNRKHILIPINTALKSATIQFVQVNNNVALVFYPKGRLFANNDSVEEGVRQLLNNYVYYVFSIVKEETQLILRAMVAYAMDHYIDFLTQEYKERRIGPARDAWNISFPMHMLESTIGISSNWGPKYQDGTDLTQIEANFRNMFTELEIKHVEMCKAMMLMR